MEWWITITETEHQLSELIESLDACELGDSIPLGNAYYIPILHHEEVTPREYITAHEALERGLLELKDSGNIDAVIVINKAPQPVLIIAGMDVHAEGTQSRRPCETRW